MDTSAKLSTTVLLKNAPSSCPGPETEKAGKSEACYGCPNQNICSSEPQEDGDILLIKERLESVKNVILVLSGKGGVGKSTVSTLLSLKLSQSLAVGVMDVDLTGPSIPCMLGVESEPVHQSSTGWTPVYVNDNLCCISIQFLLPTKDEAVIWRGDKKNGMIKQFMKDVEWDELDYLVIDTPPGTSDEHLSTIKLFEQTKKISGCVLVTTPQQVAIQDVKKQIKFCRKLNLTILGIIENMSGYECSNCHETSDLFESVPNSVVDLCKNYNIRYLGKLSVDPLVGMALDDGDDYFDLHPHSTTSDAFDSILDNILKQLQ
eukprot:NODE_65_length_23997_cov_0.327601.p8 type:complete len:318 gc:universal NODE_65_length_23997_cov_0.327601:12043-12996(+)